MKNEKYNAISIPDSLSTRVRQGIRAGEKIYLHNKRKRILGKAIITAAALLLCLGFFAMQPALAAKVPIIRDIFKFLQKDYSYQGDLDSVAQKLEEPDYHNENDGKSNTHGNLDGGNGLADEGSDAGSFSDSAYSKTVDGITVSISEAYCSVEAIYLSLSITSKEPFPDTAVDLNGHPTIYLRGSADYSFAPTGGEAEGLARGGSGSLEGTFVDAYTYVGIYRIDILDIVGNDNSLKEKYRALDAFEMNFCINQIIGELAEPEALDMQGKTKEELEAMTDEEWSAFMSEITPPDRNQFPNRYENWWFDGPFVFDIPIKVDKEGAQVITIDEMNDSGAGLYQVTKTKFEITVQEKCSEERTADGVFLAVLDADGRLLPHGGSGFSDTYAINGRDVSQIYIYVCDYTEYMDELIGCCNDMDFKDILEKRALYKKEIVF